MSRLTKWISTALACATLALSGCTGDVNTLRVTTSTKAIQTVIPSIPVNSITPNTYHRTPATSRPNNNFTTMNLKMGSRQACREANECAGDLLCLNGWCAPPDAQNRGYVGDSCSSDSAGMYECVSGVCRGGFCIATTKDRADNGAACAESVPQLCRSGVCRNGACAPSPVFPGLPQMLCENPPDCLSGICLGADEEGDQMCGYSKRFAASCAVIGAVVRDGSECCSGTRNAQGRCSPVVDTLCTQSGRCAAAVGRTCGDVGTTVTSPTQCCSGKTVNNKCVINAGRGFQPCRLNRACRTGYCNPKSNICSGYGGHEGATQGLSDQ
ncbi:MAG: hypothetical protein AAB250_06160 [Bdellovibrionota bacterium]